MSDETPGWDAQDARDRELLARGATDELIGCYVPLIVARCRNRRGAHGDDVAQHVMLRLWKELEAGRHRDGSRPFREIVNGVVAFACKGWEGTVLGRDAPLEEWTQANDAQGASPVEDDVLTQIDTEAFVASLPPGDGEIARLRFIDLLEIDQIAEQTGRTRNAVDQALFRVRREWKRWLES